MDYENVYVAHVAYGAKDTQTLHAFLEAEAHDGPSIIIAYSPCIAWGIDLADNHKHQDMAVKSGHWPLFRFDPKRIKQKQNPLRLDSPEPSIPYREFVKSETRFSMLWQNHPEEAEQLLEQSQQEINHRYHYYKQLSEIDWDDKEKVIATRAQLHEVT